MVYRFITKNTYEQAMFRAASVKLGLDYAVMHNMHHIEGISADKTAQTFSALSRKELENLLKHGAYGAFSESQEMCIEDESIEQILSRSSTILRESDEHDKTAEPKVSFSKASFVSSSSAESCVSVDDPDFWDKVVGLAVKEKEEGLLLKRRCRETVGSYKEPGLHVKGTLLNEVDYDSDDSDSRSKKRKSTAVEMSEANLKKILSAMLNKGYCNPEEICKDAKLKWSYSNIVSISFYYMRS